MSPELIKKIVFISGFFVAIFIAFLFNFNYLKPGLEINTNVKSSLIYINDNQLGTKDLKDLKPGEYELLIIAENYRHIEKNIKVNKYKKTKINITMEELKSVIDQLPYTNEEDLYQINGEYNDFLEPVYTLIIFKKLDYNPAKNKLSEMGVNIKTANIILQNQIEVEENDVDEEE